MFLSRCSGCIYNYKQYSARESQRPSKSLHGIGMEWNVADMRRNFSRDMRHGMELRNFVQNCKEFFYIYWRGM